MIWIPDGQHAFAMVILPYEVRSPDILWVDCATVAKRHWPLFDDFVEWYPYAEMKSAGRSVDRQQLT
jgi:hypothetical protein